jgi:hypothetical protein
MSRIGDSLVLSAIPDSQGLLPVIVHVNTFHLHTRFEVAMVNGTSCNSENPIFVLSCALLIRNL